MDNKRRDTRKPLGERPWDCNPLAIYCRNDHLLAFYEADWRFDARRLSGHAPAACYKCDPPTYMMVVFAKVDGMAVATVYAISLACWEEWTNGNEPSPETSELLYRLRDPHGHSHNPYWQPSTSRRR